MSVARVGVLGGTFDPFHEGHLAAGRAAVAALDLDQVLVVPSAQPPHRPDSPLASGYHRLQMARLGVADTPGWAALDLELRRGGRSFTFDTLTDLRALYPTSQFFFITGADAFAEVASWRHYPEVLELAHFVVITRTGTSLEHVRARLPELAARFVGCETTALAACRRSPFPSIFLVQAATPSVSSTEIRRRAAAGESIDGLVPGPVAEYIRAHRLYRGDSHS
jgi:nicotinate-nucleotide adenylyltransferase